ncbi:putative ABC transporter substrate binding protein [Sphingobium sp. SYK-6]|uniref:ABC transporter substrate-binding protein n=1 Tax=Sphingobium sp. (strain NBRC 103272 / SYK-6) TaxID=627192 RepID=UPI000227753F|nr:ABC transporter substrate-binding protein [Sphingobium sp. SYK-6]BAK67800.1 putative ABC transporter substrate binding protein [Sphingobium sp. SYK-6]
MSSWGLKCLFALMVTFLAAQVQAANELTIAILTNNVDLGPESALFGRLKAGLGAQGRDADSIIWVRRAANRDHHALESAAAELVALKPRLIIAGDTTSTQALAVAKRLVKSAVPVVFWSLDPVGAGVAGSFDQPGGDFSGTADAADTQRRELDLLSRLVPGLKRVGMLYNPTYAPAPGALRALQTEGAKSGIEVRPYEARSVDAFEGAVREMKADGMQAMVVGPHSLFSMNGRKIGGLALANGLPTASLVETVLQGGGVAAFGPDFNRIWFEQAIVVDAILKGQSPGSMAVRRPPAAMTLNLAAARALGLTVPVDLLGEAQRVLP